MWRLLHDSLSTFLTLKDRGVNVQSSCPLCNEGDESSTHLFLHCTFSRAIQHGFHLAIHTSDFRHMTIVQWVRQTLQLYKKMEKNDMLYLQQVFVILWTIWTHKNLVVHEGNRQIQWKSH